MITGTSQPGTIQGGAGAHTVIAGSGNTLILETLFDTATGTVCLTDLLIRRDGAADLVRQVRGVSGSVAMQTELVVRFDYGSVVPWVSPPIAAVTSRLASSTVRP